MGKNKAVLYEPQMFWLQPWNVEFCFCFSSDEFIKLGKWLSENRGLEDAELDFAYGLSTPGRTYLGRKARPTIICVDVPQALRSKHGIAEVAAILAHECNHLVLDCAQYVGYNPHEEPEPACYQLQYLVELGMKTMYWKLPSLKSVIKKVAES